MDPIGSFSGLASGIQWRDLVDQLMMLESQRRLKPVTDRKTTTEKQLEAWAKYSTLATTFRDAAKKVRDGTALGAFTVSAGASPVSGRPLLTATASTTAAPGSYRVEVLDLARANKLSGGIVTSASTALGVAGSFGLNGKLITVAASDNLSTVRDKINAANNGTTPSGVTATILSTGASEQRLMLTSDASGVSGIELIDDAGGILTQLGLVDSTKSLNLTSTGGSQTHHVSSATAAMAIMLGVTMPAPSSITIAGRTISVDLTVDSISSIAAKVLAAGGNASVINETIGGKSSYKLVADGTAAASSPDGLRTLEVLGFVENGRSSIAQVVNSQNTFTDGAATATTATLLSALSVGTNSIGIAAGDTFNIQGTRGDGTTVNLSLAVGGTDTVATLLARINDATTGFGAGTRPAVATLSAGKIVLSDGTGGDSQLALSLTVTKPAGTLLSLGGMSTATVGRAREVVAGSDATLRVDGVVLKRASNSISDAISGLTMNLQQAEVGTTVDLSVSRDTETISKSVSEVATAYNEMLKFLADQKSTKGPLASSPTLRSTFSALTSTLLTTVTGTTGSYTSGAVAGLALQKDGTLALDAAVFKAALATNFADVSRLFASSGSSANTALSFVFASEAAKPGTYAVNITTAAAVPTVTGSGFSGIYADDATADTMSITDSISGASGTISLANGDTTDSIVDKLNALFGNNKMALTASKSGNEVVLTGTRWGASAKITVAYTPGGADGTAQLGLGAAVYAGVDVAGTIGGLAATGSGRTLTGAAGGVTGGLSIDYSGIALGAAGDFTYISGLGGALYNSANVVVRTGGTIDTQHDTLSTAITALTTRAETIQQALDRRRQALIKQFIAMESAIAKLQSQGNAVTGFLASLNSNRN